MLFLLYLVDCFLILSSILHSLVELLFGHHVFLSTCYHFTHTLVVLSTYSITKLGQTSRKALDFQSALHIKDNSSTVMDHCLGIKDYIKRLNRILLSIHYSFHFEHTPVGLGTTKQWQPHILSMRTANFVIASIVITA